MDNDFKHVLEKSNGILPSPVKIHTNKRARFDGQRNLSSDSENDGDEDDESTISTQKEKDQKFMIGKLQKQIANLTNEVQKLTNIIGELQNEKKSLYEIIQRKSSPKQSTKKRKPKTIKSTQNTTHAPKPSEMTTQQASSTANVTERDNSTLNANEHENVTHTNTPNNTHAKESSAIHMSVDQGNKGEQDSDADESSDAESLSENEDNTNENSDANKNTRNIKRSTKIPPVDIWTDNRAEIQRKIQSKIPSDSCLFGRVNNGKFRVFPKDSETRSKVIEFLKQSKVQFNTYTPSNEKMINVLIKGLEHIDEPQMIEDELANRGFSPFKIQKHVTGYMRKNNLKSNLWLLVLQPNTDTKELFKIKSIDHAIVKFEFLRKPQVIQCRRCQRFNHSASNCSLPYRCVKCTDSHEPGQCKSGKNKNKFKPKCVNCQGAHTANDAANCPAFKKAIELKTTKQTESKQAKTTLTMKSQQPSKTATAPPKTTTQSSENKSVDLFINQQNKMISDFMQTMKKMQQQFIASFGQLNG